VPPHRVHTMHVAEPTISPRLCAPSDHVHRTGSEAQPCTPSVVQRAAQLNKSLRHLATRRTDGKCDDKCWLTESLEVLAGKALVSTNIEAEAATAWKSASLQELSKRALVSGVSAGSKDKGVQKSAVAEAAVSSENTHSQLQAIEESHGIYLENWAESSLDYLHDKALVSAALGQPDTLQHARVKTCDTAQSRREEVLAEHETGQEPDIASSMQTKIHTNVPAWTINNWLGDIQRPIAGMNTNSLRHLVSGDKRRFQVNSIQELDLVSTTFRGLHTHACCPVS